MPGSEVNGNCCYHHQYTDNSFFALTLANVLMMLAVVAEMSTKMSFTSIALAVIFYYQHNKPSISEIQFRK